MFSVFTDRGRLAAARAVLSRLSPLLQSGVSVRLWDGSVLPLGDNADPNLCLRVSGPGVVTSLLRRPTLDNLLRHWATGRIDVEGGDLYAFVEKARVRGVGKKLKALGKFFLFRKALPFFLHPADNSSVNYRFTPEAGVGQKESRQDADMVQFHYDVGNEFYRLFLGPHMQYSCNYFTDWSNTVEQAQTDKMEMICRKLRLKEGETLLDVGCGWGGLVCYAASRYGVRAHGLTLSPSQLEVAKERVRRMGLEERVTLELRDAHEMTGTYDKVACIGMAEHLGIANYPRFLARMNSVVRDRGIVLMQMITRGAKAPGRSFSRSRAEHRLIREYVFPGNELCHVAQMVEALEGARFEVHDVENWREHYAMTLRQWSQALSANAAEAIRLVGEERCRVWVAYLVGTSFAFADGSLRLFQVVASKHQAKGASQLPATRADLYARPMPSGSVKGLMERWHGTADVPVGAEAGE